MYSLLKSNLADGDWQAQLILAMALNVFEDYIHQTTAEQFATRFGTVGTEALARYTRK
jgi:hypothetical protein